MRVKLEANAQNVNIILWLVTHLIYFMFQPLLCLFHNNMQFISSIQLLTFILFDCNIKVGSIRSIVLLLKLQ